MQDGIEIADKQRRSRGGQPGNLNSARTFEYAHDIEERVDGRSLLAAGFDAHRRRLLALFAVHSLDDLDAFEREAVRRLVKRRVIRELAWGRVQAAFEHQDVATFNAEVPKFQDAVDREERTEARLETLLQKRFGRRVIDLPGALAAAAECVPEPTSPEIQPPEALEEVD